MDSINYIHQRLSDELGIHFEMNELSPASRELLMQYRSRYHKFTVFSKFVRRREKELKRNIVGLTTGILMVISGVLAIIFGIYFIAIHSVFFEFGILLMVLGLILSGIGITVIAITKYTDKEEK